MKTILIIAISLLLFVSVTAIAQTDPGKSEAAIRQSIKELSVALGANNVSKLESLFADEYAFINPNGVLLTRSQSLESIQNGSVKFTSFNLEDLQIRIYGDTAVVTARATVKMTDRGTERVGISRNTMVFTIRDGAWRLVASQATPIKEQ